MHPAIAWLVRRVSGTGENFKFGVRIDPGKFHLMIMMTKHLQKGRGQGPGAELFYNFLIVVVYRLVSSTNDS